VKYPKSKIKKSLKSPRNKRQNSNRKKKRHWRHKKLIRQAKPETEKEQEKFDIEELGILDT